MKYKLLYGINIVLTLLIGITAFTLATDGWNAYTAEAARRYAVERDPRPVPHVDLQDSTGTFINLNGLYGHYVLVDFIYTGCKSACTSLGLNFHQLQSVFGQHHSTEKIRLLSISFDRERDGLEQLRHYGSRFNADGTMWYITRPATRSDLTKLKQHFDVIVIPDGQEYVHNAAIYLIDPTGYLIKIFDYNQPGDIVQFFQTSR